MRARWRDAAGKAWHIQNATDKLWVTAFIASATRSIIAAIILVLVALVVRGEGVTK